MAGNGVSVAITAQDRVSSTLERINSRLARMQVPARRTFGALQRFSQVTGLTRLRGGLTGLARDGVSAFRSIGQIAPVLGTITGATSVAGIYRLASAWAKMGTEIRTTSQAIGIAPERLARLQNATRLAGGSGEAVTGALQSLSQTQWEMAHGFAPEAQATFQALFNGTGTSLKQIEQMKPDELFDRLIKRLRGIKNPAAQAIAAQKLFGGAAAGLLPILQQTEKEYRDNIRLAERYGVTNQKGADAAARLQHSVNGLTLAGEGLAYSIAEALEPNVRAVIDQMAGWIGQNRQWIALRLKHYFDEVADAVRGVIKWLQDGGWDKITSKVKGIVDVLGGWKGVAIEAGIAVAALYAAPVLLGLASFALSVMAISKAFGAMEASAKSAYDVSSSPPGWNGNPIGGPKMGPSAEAIGAFASALGWLGLGAANGITDDQAASNRQAIRRLPGLDFIGRTYEHAQGAYENISGSNLNKAYEVYRSLRKRGWTSAQAAGWVSNFAVEDPTFDPKKEGDNGTAVGIGQWHAPRQADFQRLYGHSLRNSTLSEQIEFADWESRNGTYKTAGDAIRSMQTASGAAAAASGLFFRPQDQFGEMDRRAATATTWQRRLEERERYGNNGFAAWGHDLLERARGALSASEPSVVKVEIDHKNAPSGTKVKASSSSPSVQITSVRTSKAMDPVATATGY